MKETIENGKSNIRKYVVVGLGILISYWIIFIVLFNLIYIPDILVILLSLIELVIILFCFVNSIRHLIYYTNGKGIAITALIISGIFLLIYFLAFMTGFIKGIMGL